jgi:hypothetical protein
MESAGLQLAKVCISFLENQSAGSKVEMEILLPTAE